MKKYFLLLLLFLFFTKCATIPEMNRQVVITTFDLCKYSEKNFLITPEPYEGEYKSIGFIYATIIPEVKLTQYSVKMPGFYEVIVGKQVANIEILDPHMALDEFYAKADSMGADAIMNFRVGKTDVKLGDFLAPTYELSGFAIKRKN